MPRATKITQENAQFHCRTCLNSLAIDENVGNGTAGKEKPKIFDITAKPALQRVIAANTEGDEDFAIHSQLYPQRVCWKCFKKLRTLKRFRRRMQRSSDTLRSVFPPITATDEIEDEEEELPRTRLRKNTEQELYQVSAESKPVSLWIPETNKTVAKIDTSFVDPFSDIDKVAQPDTNPIEKYNTELEKEVSSNKDDALVTESEPSENEAVAGSPSCPFMQIAPKVAQPDTNATEDNNTELEKEVSSDKDDALVTESDGDCELFENDSNKSVEKIDTSSVDPFSDIDKVTHPYTNPSEEYNTELEKEVSSNKDDALVTESDGDCELFENDSNKSVEKIDTSSVDPFSDIDKVTHPYTNPSEEYSTELEKEVSSDKDVALVTESDGDCELFENVSNKSVEKIDTSSVDPFSDIDKVTHPYTNPSEEYSTELEKEGSSDKDVALVTESDGDCELFENVSNKSVEKIDTSSVDPFSDIDKVTHPYTNPSEEYSTELEKEVSSDKNVALVTESDGDCEPSLNDSNKSVDKIDTSSVDPSSDIDKVAQSDTNPIEEYNTELEKEVTSNEDDAFVTESDGDYKPSENEADAGSPICPLKQIATTTRNEGDEHPYFCDQCNKKYKTISGLRYHKKAVHQSDSPRFHSKTVHLKQKPFSCEHCHRSFARRKTLIDHTRIHAKEKLYICDICGVQFRQPSAFKTHYKTHSKKLASNPVV